MAFVRMVMRALEVVGGLDRHTVHQGEVAVVAPQIGLFGVDGFRLVDVWRAVV